MALASPIVPVSPVHEQRVAGTNTSIILDFENTATLITVNGTTAYDNTSGFQNGYTGGTISWTDGTRIYADPPSSFTRHSTVEVHAEDNLSNEVDYSFIAAIDQMTTTNDAETPDIIDVDGTNVYLGYNRRERTYARKHDPNTAEVDFTVGHLFAFGYNPVSDKVIAFININGVVYATEADPGDAPTTLSDVSDLLDYAPTESGVGHRETRTKQQYYAWKWVRTDTIATTPGVGQDGDFSKTPEEDHNPTPVLTSADPVSFRIPAPTAEPEQSAIYGYYIAKLFVPTNIISGPMDFIAFPAGASYVDWTDDGRPTNTHYVIIPLYLFNDSQVIPTEGPRTDPIEIPDNFYGDLVAVTVGVGRRTLSSVQQYYERAINRTDAAEATVGTGRRFRITVSGFGEKGIGS